MFFFALKFNFLLSRYKPMRWIFILLLSFFPVFMHAQQAVVGLPAMNVLYIGLDNEVKIAVAGHKTKKLVKEFTGGDIIESEGKLYLRVYNRGDARLRIGIKKKEDTLWVDSMEFRIRRMLLPLPQLGTLQNGSVESAATIRANATRVFMGLGSWGSGNEDPKFTVEKFNITLIDSCWFETFHCTGNVIPPHVSAHINRLNPGGKIIINRIYFNSYNHRGTFYQNELSDDDLVITVRPGGSDFSITGSFSNTPAGMQFYSHRYINNNFTAFAGKTKNGEWNYYTGHCPARLWSREVYDTGLLKTQKIWDSTGRLVIDAYRPEPDGPLFIKELYRTGETRRLGWVQTDLAGYVFWGEAGKKATDNINPVLQHFRNMRFIPVGDWKEYHPNGKLKLTGSFATIPFKDNGDYYYITDKSSLPQFASVADGKWTEYDENGNIKKEYIFDKGVLLR